MNVATPTLWDTVVINLAPIILAMTGLVTTLGGFWLQKRKMDKQNAIIATNAEVAQVQRTELTHKVEDVAVKAATAADAANTAVSAATNAQATLSQKLEEVHLATNSMKDELVKSTAKASHAEGMAEGRQLSKEEIP